LSCGCPAAKCIVSGRSSFAALENNSMAHKAEIGLHRARVELVAHNPKWAECFSEEKELLPKILGEKILDLRHIGSTSAPGILAKPILDMLAAVKGTG
jgi:GrpB-like predicted nucleotidyltransferase (UPF0157 family)